MQWAAHKSIVLTASLGAVLIAGVLVWTPLLPWSANHFGFALPGPGGLPYRVGYRDRSYATPGRCANAGWCSNQQPVCYTAAELQSRHEWPFQRVGDLPALGSAPYPMFAQSTPAYPTTMVLYVQVGSCYVPYELEGGP